MKKPADILKLLGGETKSSESETKESRRLASIVKKINDLLAQLQQRVASTHHLLRFVSAGAGYIINEQIFPERPLIRMPVRLGMIGGAQGAMRAIENFGARHYYEINFSTLHSQISQALAKKISKDDIINTLERYSEQLEGFNKTLAGGDFWIALLITGLSFCIYTCQDVGVGALRSRPGGPGMVEFLFVGSMMAFILTALIQSQNQFIEGNNLQAPPNCPHILALTPVNDRRGPASGTQPDQKSSDKNNNPPSFGKS